MSLKVADVDRVFTKLRMETRDGRDKLAWFVHDGKRILFTRHSHGRGDLPGRMGHFIRQQLQVNQAQFNGLISCSVSRADYVEILAGKGLIAGGP